MSAEGSQVLDRSCTGCASGSYSVGANAMTCSTWTTCAPGTFISTNGTSTTDRVCSSCAAGSFSATSNANGCTVHTVCPAGTELVAAGTTTQDTTCAACAAGTYCAGAGASKVTCAGENFDHDSASATPCALRTTCGVGTIVVSNGTATSDRTCASCNTGSFSLGNNAASCTAWRTCDVGTYVSVQGTITSDRTCTACATGTYANQTNQSVCLPHNACAAGTWQTAPGTATSAPTCATCTAGTYCAGGTSAVENCSADTYDHDNNPATPCASKTVCQPGERVVSNGSATSNRSCQACDPGSFSTAQNSASCTLWTTCQAGTWVSTTPTTSRDRACTACASGTFSSTQNANSCGSHSTCASGNEQLASGTASTDTQCAICAAGTYCAGGTTPKVTCAAGTWDHDQNSATACVTKTTCMPGQYETSAGSTTQDRSCQACGPNSYSTTSNASSCTAWSDCQAGTYVSTAGSSTTNRACTACASGTFSTSANASSCTAWSDCQAGTYVSTAGSSTTNRTCTACASGTTTTAPNQTSCDPTGPISDYVLDDFSVGITFDDGNPATVLGGKFFNSSDQEIPSGMGNTYTPWGGYGGGTLQTNPGVTARWIDTDTTNGFLGDTRSAVVSNASGSGRSSITMLGGSGGVANINSPSGNVMRLTSFSYAFSPINLAIKNVFNLGVVALDATARGNLQCRLFLSDGTNTATANLNLDSAVIGNNQFNLTSSSNWSALNQSRVTAATIEFTSSTNGVDYAIDDFIFSSQ